MENTITKHNLGTKGFISASAVVQHEGKSGQDLEAGADAEATEDCCGPDFTLRLLPYKLQVT